MAHGNFGNTNRQNKWKQGQPVTKALYEKTIRRIQFLDDHFDVNNIPPGSNLKYFKTELSELHAIVRAYQDQNKDNKQRN